MGAIGAAPAGAIGAGPAGILRRGTPTCDGEEGVGGANAAGDVGYRPLV